MVEARFPSAGSLVRRARLRHGIGQRELARRAATAQAQVSRIERDAISPSLATLDGLLGAMGEGLAIASRPLDQPPPGGGNTTTRELRAGFTRMTPPERLELAAELSRVQTQLAASARRR